MPTKGLILVISFCPMRPTRDYNCAYTQWKLTRAAYFYRLLHKLFLPKRHKLRAREAQVSKMQQFNLNDSQRKSQ